MSEEIINVKDSIPTKSGKELMMEKATNESVSEATSLLDQARVASEELKANLAEHKKVLDEMKALAATELLKGRAEAGQTKVVKEETPKEYADRMMGIKK